MIPRPNGPRWTWTREELAEVTQRLIRLAHERGRDLTALRCRVRDLEAENARLTEALREFSKHDLCCPASWEEPRCVCGLAEALKPEEPR